MKRLFSKNDRKNLDTREQVLMTTPAYPSFGHQNEFTKSDEKSFSRMMNEPVIEKIEKEKKEIRMSNKSRLKKIAMMPVNMFEGELDQISDKGRNILKAIEDYKFFVDQTTRVMKNDPALSQVIIGKKKNLEEAAQKIYDIVFDIENLDIVALYERQQQEALEQQNGQQFNPNAPGGPAPTSPNEQNQPVPGQNPNAPTQPNATPEVGTESKPGPASTQSMPTAPAPQSKPAPGPTKAPAPNDDTDEEEDIEDEDTKEDKK